MGMHPIPRPPFGDNPRRPEEKDLDDATEHDHRTRKVAGRPTRGRVRRFLRAVFSRPRR